MPQTEILSKHPMRQPLRAKGRMRIPLKDGARLVKEWARNAGMACESLPLWRRFLFGARRRIGRFLGIWPDSHDERVELILIEYPRDPSPGYDFHVILRRKDGSTTDLEVAVLNHVVTVRLFMEQRLKEVVASLESL